MPVGLFPRESSDILSVPPTEGGTSAPPEPGFLAGLPGSIATGVEEGGTKAALSVLPQTAATNVGLPPIGAPDWAYQKYEESIKKQAAVDPDEYKAKLAQDSTALLQTMRADPHTVGTAGQMLHGLASGISRFVAGSAVGGPVGGAITVGGSEGQATQRELTAGGVDENTANALGAGTALFAGGTSLLPGGYGKTLLNRILTGAGANTVSGFTQRGLTHNVLESAGYTAQAQQYRALDGQAMMADTVLGAGFGAVHHAFAPSTIDAAHTIADADHVETSAPGIPTTPESRNAHVANMDAAAEALISGEPMRPLQDVETIANPAQDAASVTNARAVDEAALEASGEPVAPPERVGEERRSDAITDTRLAELTNKHNDGTLTPAETAEWAQILNQRRLTTRVAGRTIRGVGSYEAYTEALARGEQSAVTGFADSDMLHATNLAHGYPVGDELIRATGETLAHYFGEGNVFRRASDTGGSDEFITHAATPEAHDAAMAAAQQHMANMTLRAYKDGKLIGEKKGAGFSHGRGHDEASAVVAAKLDKQRRAAEGLRRERDDTGAVAAKPATDARPGGGVEAAGAETAGEVGPQKKTTEQAYAEFLGDTFKRRIMEEKGQEILDDMIENGESPQDVARKFWDETYWNMPAEVQRKFDKEYKAHSGGFLPHEIENKNELLAQLDLGSSAEHLEGTERGFVVLMHEANQRFAQTREYASERPPEMIDVTPRAAEPKRIAAPLDPATQEVVDAAQRVLDAAPDTKVAGEDGIEHAGADAMKQAMADLNDAKAEGDLHKIAAACFGRG